MDPTPKPAGAVVDRRLAPAGITRLLGGHGSGRAKLLALAAAMFALRDGGAAARRRARGVPRARCSSCRSRSIAAEFGARVGVLGAAICVVTLIASPVGNWLAQDGTTIAARSCALLFVALVIGRLADRGAKSRRLLEQLLEATTDSIYLKDLDGRYLLVNSATARLIGRPGEAIVGRTNAELLPEVAGEIADHDADVIARDAPDVLRDQRALRPVALHPVGHEKPVSRRDGRDDRRPRHRPRHHRAAPAAGREHALLRPLGRHALHGRLRRAAAARQRRVAAGRSAGRRPSCSAATSPSSWRRATTSCSGARRARARRRRSRRARHDPMARTATAVALDRVDAAHDRRRAHDLRLGPRRHAAARRRARAGRQRAPLPRARARVAGHRGAARRPRAEARVASGKALAAARRPPASGSASTSATSCPSRSARARGGLPGGGRRPRARLRPRLAEHGLALWVRTSPLRGERRARSPARCSSPRTCASASRASARSARRRSASGARSRTRRSGWPSPTSRATTSRSTRRCARSSATRRTCSAG